MKNVFNAVKIFLKVTSIFNDIFIYDKTARMIF